ncbi:hypothetical protein [Novosphingobium sp.]|uniref:hypothetical protein n=1 Tax=Novosphingobium sp. TaxID=1874826 RepID=UPI003D125A31
MPTRIRERDLIIPALRAIATAPGGELTTTALIASLEGEFLPEGQDAEILEGRSDTYFSQKVRNLVSHATSSTSMFTRGYAVRHPENESISITDAGRAFLDTVPQE